MSQAVPNSYRAMPDERGHFGDYGGRYVAETHVPAGPCKGPLGSEVPRRLAAPWGGSCSSEPVRGAQERREADGVACWPAPSQGCPSWPCGALQGRGPGVVGEGELG